MPVVVNQPEVLILNRLARADMDLDLTTYELSGSKKSKFRQAMHKIEREGYMIEERDVRRFFLRSSEGRIASLSGLFCCGTLIAICK